MELDNVDHFTDNKANSYKPRKQPREDPSIICDMKTQKTCQKPNIV